MKGTKKLYLLCSLLAFFTAGCSGTLGNAAGAVAVNPNSVDFNSVAVNSGASQALSLVNTTTDVVTVDAATSTSAQFSLAGMTLPLTLQPSESRTVQATFSPAAAQAYSADLSLSYHRSSGPGSSRIPVSGTGVTSSSTGMATVSPTTISFGSLNVGNVSSTSFTLKNTGTATLVIQSFASSSAAFQISGPSLPASVAPGNFVTFTVVFIPTSAGSLSASVSIATNASNGTVQVALTGSGGSTSAAPPSSTQSSSSTTSSAAPLNASTTAVSFGTVAMGSSTAQNVSLTNAGSSTITVSKVTISGSGFNATGLASGQVISAGQVATLNISFAPSASGSASGSVMVASNASDSALSLSLNGVGGSGSSSPTSTSSSSSSSVSGAPTCGVSGDVSVHVPTDWSTFTPPAKGQSYVDKTFGCTVTRITDSSTEDWNGSVYLPINHGYATVSPFNTNDTSIMLADGWNRHFVTDLTGNIKVPIANMPTANDSWVLWDASDPNRFYYANGNSLMAGEISGSAVTASTVHQFTEYTMVNFMDETDVSEDGAHVVMVGGDSSGADPENVFDYNFASNLKGPVYTTQCVASVDSPNNACLHKLIQTPDNNVIIQFANDGAGAEQGNRLWTGSTPLTPLQDETDHLDAGYDMNGSAVFIEIGNSTILPGTTNPCPSGWGTDVRQIYNVLSSVCLVDSLAQKHVSYRGSANQPWVGISYFDADNTSPEWFDNTSNYTAPTSSNWYQFEDEVTVVRVDANNNSNYIFRLARAYSRSDEDFYATPRAAISRDGTYIAFGSNMAYAHTGCPAGQQTSTGCTDVYVIKIK